MANNQKPVLSYAWDVNTGNVQYLPGDESEDPIAQSITPQVTPKITKHEDLPWDTDEDELEGDDIDF